jgi:hypothetical protein
VSLQVEQTLCSEQKQCALSGEIINNSPPNENQQIATPFFSSLLEMRVEPLHSFAGGHAGHQGWELQPGERCVRTHSHVTSPATTLPLII